MTDICSTGRVETAHFFGADKLLTQATSVLLECVHHVRGQRCGLFSRLMPGSWETKNLLNKGLEETLLGSALSFVQVGGGGAGFTLQCYSWKE